MDQLTQDDVIAINKLLEFASIARSNGRRCDVEMHFHSSTRAIALKLDLSGEQPCYAVAFEPNIPEAVDRVIEQASESDTARKTDPAPPAFDLDFEAPAC